MWDWIKADAEAITAVATVMGLLSLVLIFKQLRDARLWNKLHFTYTFFPNPVEFEAIEVFLDERLSFWRRDAALTELEVKALIGKETLSDEEKATLSKAFGPSVTSENPDKELYEAGRKLKMYMNQIEAYCAAINSGIVDSESAKNVHSYRFKRAYEKSLPWVEKMRSIKNESSLFIETAKVLNMWHPLPRGQKTKY